MTVTVFDSIDGRPCMSIARRKYWYDPLPTMMSV